MSKSSIVELNRKRLIRWLILFFLALAIPTGILINQAYTKMKWEVFHQHQTIAEELTTRIDLQFIDLIKNEEKRAFTQYTFLNVTGSALTNILQRSPLSNFPIISDFPGLLGYFQVDSLGGFSTPILPEITALSGNYGIDQNELAQRMALHSRIRGILNENRLVQVNIKPVPPRKVKNESVNTFSRQELPAQQELQFKDYDAAGSDYGIQSKSQAAFDQLSSTSAESETTQKKSYARSLGRVEDLKLDARYPMKSKQQSSQSKKRKEISDWRGTRKERNILPQQNTQFVPQIPERKEKNAPSAAIASVSNAIDNTDYQLSIFESIIDSFEVSLLDSGHMVLYRKVWREGQRYIQGFLVEPKLLFRTVIEASFYASNLSQMSNLAVAYQGSVISAFGGQSSRRYLSSTEELQGALLYQTRLSAPLNDLELIFSINRLPAAPGGSILNWVVAIIIIVLVGGFYLMYRLGEGQIKLSRQQQDFISAVSHELKTPLTSIRMYGEILKEGWADDAKKKDYYNYIYDESERLSRLINNVLQLARMTRNDVRVDLKAKTVHELLDSIQSKISSQIEQAGFTLVVDCDAEISGAQLLVDSDYFTQIIINLVDNAIKFTAKAADKRIVIKCCSVRNQQIQFAVRDFGPGVAKDQMKKIFKLFYRPENELTREAVGTGIGLALVQQLVLAMNGKIDVINQNPGAEFHVTFPCVKNTT